MEKIIKRLYSLLWKKIKIRKKDIAIAQKKLNLRPGKKLGFKTPLEVFRNASNLTLKKPFYSEILFLYESDHFFWNSPRPSFFIDDCVNCVSRHKQNIISEDIVVDLKTGAFRPGKPPFYG